jgi:plastocyanin
VKIAAALLACALVLTGCGGSDGSGEADGGHKAAGTTVDIVVKDGKVTPQGTRVKVKAGDPVTLKITSDADEEIHVHSDPEHEYEVKAGDPIDETFTIDTPGQVAVEAHHLDVTIVQLVVEP